MFPLQHPLSLEVEATIRRALIDGLPPDRPNDFDPTQRSTRELMLFLRNYRHRLISRRPRAVHWSRELAGTIDGIECRDAMLAIVQKFEMGDDLTSHLSKAVRCSYPLWPFPERAVDRLLADWGVHHLHVSTETGSGGFTARTDSLLFCVVRPNDVYLIDVFGHGQWTDRHILEIMLDNWPDDGLVVALTDGHLDQPPPTEEELQQLRKAGVTVVMEVRSSVVMPCAGMSVNGTPLDVAEHANHVAYRLLALDNALVEHGVGWLDSQFEAPLTRSGPARWEPFVAESDELTVSVIDLSAGAQYEFTTLVRP